MLLVLIIVIVFILCSGGYYEYRCQYYGNGGIGLIGIVVIVLPAMALFGGPRLGWY